MSANMWFPKEALEKKGACFGKLVKQLDQRIAAQESMMARPLTEANVRAHYACVGLDSEYSDHCRIQDLSGGQKVKVVLGACTWACPHLIILDEPTNYLDRDSLGALANAIKEFAGGVVLITHNKEFADATTRETWVVANNKCDVKGDPEWEKYAAEAVEEALEQETKDACGNIVKKKDKIPELEDMTRKEVKKYKKAIKAKVKRGEELELHEFIWADAWNIEVPE
jgi:elongation factor 3